MRRLDNMQRIPETREAWGRGRGNNSSSDPAKSPGSANRRVREQPAITPREDRVRRQVNTVEETIDTAKTPQEIQDAIDEANK